VDDRKEVSPLAVGPDDPQRRPVLEGLEAVDDVHPSPIACMAEISLYGFSVPPLERYSSTADLFSSLMATREQRSGGGSTKTMPSTSSLLRSRTRHTTTSPHLLPFRTMGGLRLRIFLYALCGSSLSSEEEDRTRYGFSLRSRPVSESSTRNSSFEQPLCMTGAGKGIGSNAVSASISPSAWTACGLMIIVESVGLCTSFSSVGDWKLQKTDW